MFGNNSTRQIFFFFCPGEDHSSCIGKGHLGTGVGEGETALQRCSVTAQRRHYPSASVNELLSCGLCGIVAFAAAAAGTASLDLGDRHLPPAQRCGSGAWRQRWSCQRCSVYRVASRRHSSNSIQILVAEFSSTSLV
ncbi:hypothetical protein ACLKA6_012456 [Drosophila palustris]